MAIARSRDPEAVRAGLARWLAASRPPVGAVRVSPLTAPTGGGLSSDTFLFDATWEAGGEEQRDSLVARLPPHGDGLFPRYDLASQAHLMAALREHSDVPVPTVRAFVEDPAWVGAPFMVMERVEGQVPTDNPPYLLTGWVRDAGPDEQARLQGSFLDALAAIHRVQWDGAAALGTLARARGTDLAAEVEHWAAYVDWAGDGAPPAVVADGLAWCRERRPAAESPPALLWGDVRIPNVVFGADFRVRAVLDWEMASIGPPEVDLGWYRNLHRLTTAACGADLPGFLDEQTTVTAYADRAGHRVDDLAWYDAWGALRSAAIMVRMAHLLYGLGVTPDLSLAERNPPADALRQVIAAG